MTTDPFALTPSTPDNAFPWCDVCEKVVEHFDREVDIALATRGKHKFRAQCHGAVRVYEIEEAMLRSSGRRHDFGTAFRKPDPVVAPTAAEIVEGMAESIEAVLPSRTGPTIKRGQSKQDHGTPWEFIRAIEARFGPLTYDLAATDENHKAPKWITPEQDSFSVDWSQLEGLHFLNPPFANIAPWAEKCASQAHPLSRIILLVPASIGAQWFRRHVEHKAIVIGITRITFEGSPDAYPKDLAIMLFGFGASGFGTWRWEGGSD
jgi:phage N-6-adenine-methyltransferase